MDTKRALQIFIPAIIGLVIALMTHGRPGKSSHGIYGHICVCYLLADLSGHRRTHRGYNSYDLICSIGITDFKTAFAPLQVRVWLVIAAFGIAAVSVKPGC